MLPIKTGRLEASQILSENLCAKSVVLHAWLSEQLLYECHNLMDDRDSNGQSFSISLIS